MFPMFLDLYGRAVVLVGAGTIADQKRRRLVEAGADVRTVRPEAFVPGDLDGAWLVVAVASAEINKAVAAAAAERRLFLNTADDPANASAFLGGVLRRSGVTVAISTDGAAPALTSLLREGIDELLPEDLEAWMAIARASRVTWKNDGVALDARKPLLLKALNELYGVNA